MTVLVDRGSQKNFRRTFKKFAYQLALKKNKNNNVGIV